VSRPSPGDFTTDTLADIKNNDMILGREKDCNLYLVSFAIR